MSQTVNSSGLKPLGQAVLVKQYEPEKRKGLIELPDMVKEKAMMIEQRATVVEVGPWAWHDEPTPRAVPGDRVLVSKFAGHIAQGVDGQLYRLVNGRDVFCALTAEAQNV